MQRKTNESESMKVSDVCWLNNTSPITGIFLSTHNMMQHKNIHILLKITSFCVAAWMYPRLFVFEVEIASSGEVASSQENSSVVIMALLAAASPEAANYNLQFV